MIASGFLNEPSGWAVQSGLCYSQARVALGPTAPHLMQRRLCLKHMVSCKALRDKCPWGFPCATSRGARQDAHRGRPRLVDTPAHRDTYVTPGGAIGVGREGDMGASRRHGEPVHYGLEGSARPVNLSRCHGPSWPSPTSADGCQVYGRNAGLPTTTHVSKRHKPSMRGRTGHKRQAICKSPTQEPLSNPRVDGGAMRCPERNGAGTGQRTGTCHYMPFLELPIVPYSFGIRPWFW